MFTERMTMTAFGLNYRASGMSLNTLASAYIFAAVKF